MAVSFLLHRDVLIMGATSLVYKDELFVYNCQTISLCLLYDNQVLVQQLEKGMVKYKKEQISDNNMQQHLELQDNDPDFKALNAYFNGGVSFHHFDPLL